MSCQEMYTFVRLVMGLRDNGCPAIVLSAD